MKADAASAAGTSNTSPDIENPPSRAALLGRTPTGANMVRQNT
jgi:hypothetical protein